MPLPCLAFAPLVAFGVHRAPAEGQEPTFAPSLLLCPPGEAQPRELVWLKGWKWSGILLALHHQHFLWKEQAGELGTGEAAGEVCTSQGSLSPLWSFLKKEQGERKEEKTKSAGRTGGKGELEASVFPPLLKKLLGRNSHSAPS